MPCAEPRQRSPRTERCTSLSTSTEQGNAGSSRLASRIPSQPPSWGASVTLPDTGSTTPGVPTPTACRLLRSTAAVARTSSVACADEIEESVGGLPIARARPASDRADHLAREVGDHDQHLVGADVDAEHMAQVAAEAEQAGARPGTPRRGVETGDAFRQVPGLEQKLHRAVDGRLGEAGHPGQLRAGDRPVGADRAQHSRRVEAAEEPR